MGLVPDLDDETVKQTQHFIQQTGITWANGIGAEGALEQLGVLQFPSTIVVGRDGKVVWNSTMGGTLEEALEFVVSSGSGV